jgi:putative colanic acid biosynthesis UDP-glucose lipid carrier transferase
MFKTRVPDSPPSAFHQDAPSALGKDNLLSVFDSLVTPATIVGTLWVLAFQRDGELLPQYLMLAVIIFALTFPGKSRLTSSLSSLFFDVLFNWSWIAGLLVICAITTGYAHDFSRGVFEKWVWLAPTLEIAASLALRASAPYLVKLQGPRQRAIVVGMNAQGMVLAKRLDASPLHRIEFVGFVDSRNPERLPSNTKLKPIGKIDELALVVRNLDINIIYLSLPMASQPRILHILDELKDTTASIYFVPDMFVTDLIQGQAGNVCGMPVISVCETPFHAFNGVLKRASDIFFSLSILALIFPLMFVIALAVRLTSSGPIIFKQRRYGLDGQKILVYKFRSMTVTEDGGVVPQAKKNDARVTRLGAFLRRTSLDELPQFINVLQGRMSIVGPRPHAVAHNELYRKLIKGYMVRHKVKPGITGWAQVNGFRGETDTLEKMQGRIDYDLDYLRNWSLALDIQIILRTVKIVAKDSKAY